MCLYFSITSYTAGDVFSLEAQERLTLSFLALGWSAPAAAASASRECRINSALLCCSSWSPQMIPPESPKSSPPTS